MYCSHHSAVQARDGVCDEGRLFSADHPRRHAVAVRCDLGTDCADCGPWLPTTQDVPWWVGVRTAVDMSAASVSRVYSLPGICVLPWWGVLPCMQMYCHARKCTAMHAHVLPCTHMYCHACTCTAMHAHVLPCTHIPRPGRRLRPVAALPPPRATCLGGGAYCGQNVYCLGGVHCLAAILPSSDVPPCTCTAFRDCTAVGALPCTCHHSCK